VSKPSRCSNREARKKSWKERKKAQKELRKQQKEQGFEPHKKPALPNRKSELETPGQEQAERQKVIEEQLKAYRMMLPKLLKQLEKIKDYRNPKKSKHKLAVLLILGVLTFAFQLSSRREANREMTRAVFLENLKLLFPEIDTVPHQDTLYRLLCKIDVSRIEQAAVELIQYFIRNKKFRNYLVGHRYCVAVDGTQKFKRDYPFAEECSTRRVKGADEENIQYYVCILEATIVFPNGISLPLLSEFCEYAETDDKQDCELKAFKRLAKRLKRYFPRLPIMILLDGLYPNGPVFELCRRYNWQFMIVLQDKSLSSVHEEAAGLEKLDEGQNIFERKWGNRQQHFWWVNDIIYEYGLNGRKKQKLHYVVCEESWQEIDKKTNEVIKKTSRHVWVSSHPITKNNVHQRCNLMARYRWGIETNILVEKCHGYQYEHCFSYNWNAMKGYHYLMRLAHLMNTIAFKTLYLAEKVCQMGVRPLIKFIYETLKAPWLNAERIVQLLTKKHQLRLA